MDMTEDTTTKPVKTVQVKKVLDAFNASVDVNQNYSLDDLKKLLVSAYKASSKKSERTEKREPSKYNIFVKNEMTRLKSEHPDKSNKEIMSMAAALWNKSKDTEPTV
jgi:ABC-type molybdate transport system substrate-binding protein